MAHRRRMMAAECVGGHAEALLLWAEDQPDGPVRAVVISVFLFLCFSGVLGSDLHYCSDLV